jgi:hypothetical protein
MPSRSTKSRGVSGVISLTRAGVGADPGYPTVRRRHLDADFVGGLAECRGKDRLGLLTVETLVALRRGLTDAHLDAGGRVFGEVALVYGELQRRLDGRHIHVTHRDVGHAAGEQRVLPVDDVGARCRRGVVVTETSDQAVDDRRPALHRRRRELGLPGVGFEDRAQRCRCLRRSDGGRTGRSRVRAGDRRHGRGHASGHGLAFEARKGLHATVRERGVDA